MGGGGGGDKFSLNFAKLKWNRLKNVLFQVNKLLYFHTNFNLLLKLHLTYDMNLISFCFY